MRLISGNLLSSGTSIRYSEAKVDSCCAIPVSTSSLFWTQGTKANVNGLLVYIGLLVERKMSDEDFDERPSFGGTGYHSRHDAGLGWGSQQRGSGDGSDNEAEPGASYPPRKRPRINHQNGIRDKSVKANQSTGSGGKMTFAQREMAKMGWKAGQGLGAEGKGRLAPIEVVQRPTGAGVGSVREKTEQAKKEERRAREIRGEKVEDSSEEERKKRKAAKHAKRNQAHRAGMATTQLRKPKYVSAEDLEADLHGSNMPRSLLEFAIDLSGNRIAGQQSEAVPGFTAGITSAGENDTDRQAKRIQRELMSCAESKHGLNAQRSTLSDQEHHLVGNIDRNTEDSHTIANLLHSTMEMKELTLSGSTENTVFWEDITKKMEQLRETCHEEQDLRMVQEIAIGAIHPAFRSSIASWEPLKKPKHLVHFLKRLRPILSAGTEANARSEQALHMSEAPHKRPTDYYETMIYSLWLPRITSVARNDFEVENPEAMINLMKAWKPLLPAGVYANLMNHTVIPRIVTALRSWRPSRSNSRKTNPPDAWIFPWLELLPTHQLDADSANSMLSDVKRKLRKLMSSHPFETGIPTYITPWRDLLGSAYSSLLTTNLLPRLAAYLSQRLIIDPANQDMEPIETVLAYTSLFSTDTMARLIAAEFFPKFHNILYQWLIAPTVNYDEVTEWWTWWKAQIPAKIRDHPIIQPEWTDALNKIGRALDLGPRAAEDLDPPTALKNASISSAAMKTGDTPHPSHATTRGTAMPETAEITSQRELTFRDIISDWCEEHDLLCVPTREAHPGTGEPILRITARADQRGGILAYARGDVLYVRSKKDRSLWDPTELGPELEKRASE